MRYPYSLVVDFAPAKSSQNNWGNALAMVDTSARMACVRRKASRTETKPTNKAFPFHIVRGGLASPHSGGMMCNCRKATSVV